MGVLNRHRLWQVAVDAVLVARPPVSDFAKRPDKAERARLRADSGARLLRRLRITRRRDLEMRGRIASPTIKISRMTVAGD